MFSYGMPLIWAGGRGMAVQNCRVNWKMLVTKNLTLSTDALRGWIVGEGLRASHLNGRVMAPGVLLPPGSLQSGECDVGICLFRTLGAY